MQPASSGFSSGALGIDLWSSGLCSKDLCLLSCLPRLSVFAVAAVFVVLFLVWVLFFFLSRSISLAKVV